MKMTHIVVLSCSAAVLLGGGQFGLRAQTPDGNMPVEVAPSAIVTPAETPSSIVPTPPPPPPSVPARPRPPARDRRSIRPSVPTGSTPASGVSSSGSKALAKTESGLVKLDFPQAEIADVAKAISELTQRNFLLDERVRGKITIMSPTPVTVDEAYQAFVSALEVKGFTIIRVGKIYKIVELRDMKSQPIQTDTEGEGASSDLFMTRLLPLQYIKASEIVKSLRGLITKNGDMISYDPTNTLIITDTLANIRRMLKVIDKLDQPGYSESMEVVRLKYSAASDIAEKLKKIFDLQDRAPGAAAPAPDKGGDSGRNEYISKIIPDDRTNSLIVMANKEGLRRIREVVTKLDQTAEAEASKGKIHIHYLQYADATELSSTLVSLSGGARTGGRRTGAAASASRRRGSTGAGSMFTRGPGLQQNPPPMPESAAPGGATSGSLDIFGGEILITADPPTNALVITAAPADYEALLPIIHKLDVRRPQAFIEAMILEVDVERILDIGTAAHAGGAVNNTAFFGATQVGAPSTLGLGADPTNALAGLAGQPGLIFGTLGKSVDIPVAGQTITLPAYGATFKALQTNGTINILSTPNILTSDNMEAEIVVGQVVPFITAQGRDINNQPINQVQRENVALTLRVTPQINESDDVTMDIFQQIDDIASENPLLGPTTSTRSAKTTVLVKDGQTVTVGGLISDRISDSVTKVPVLGDIPIIGWFFKSKTKSKRKTSLVLLITPHIVRTPEDLETVSVRSNRNRQRFLKENAVPEHPGLAKYNLDKDLRVPPEKVKPEKRDSDVVGPDGPTGEFLPKDKGE